VTRASDSSISAMPRLADDVMVMACTPVLPGRLPWLGYALNDEMMLTHGCDPVPWRFAHICASVMGLDRGLSAGFLSGLLAAGVDCK